MTLSKDMRKLVRCMVRRVLLSDHATADIEDTYMTMTKASFYGEIARNNQDSLLIRFETKSGVIVYEKVMYVGILDSAMINDYDSRKALRESVIKHVEAGLRAYSDHLMDILSRS